MLSSFVLKTEFNITELVTVSVKFWSYNSSGGFKEELSIEFVNLNSMVSCDLVSVWPVNVSVVFKI